MFSATSVGRLRKINQDSIAFDETIGYGIVADGIGGKPGGDIASKIATQTITSAFYHQSIKFSQISKFMFDQVLQANQNILSFGESKPQYKGLGTTLDFIYFAGDAVHIVHLGDSRTYLYYKDHLFQLTIDHNIETLAQRKQAQIDKRAKAHANKLTNGLGFRKHPELQCYRKSVLSQEIYITASDGLFDMVEDAEIKNIIFHGQDQIDEIPKNLVDQANLNGGRDNISVLLSYVQY